MLVESTKIENASFPSFPSFSYKIAMSEAIVNTNRIVSTKQTYHKERSFACNYFIYLKICFSLSTSYEDFLWCTNHPNVHIHTFHNPWIFNWVLFFPVSILNWVLISLYTIFASVNFGENMRHSCAAFGCTNPRLTTSLQFYYIPSAKRYPEQIIKWVTAMRREKWPAKKINSARICSAHFATYKPS